MLMPIASWKDPANWSRNLHRLIQRLGLSLNVVVNNVLCPCLFRNRITQVPWPVLFLSSWLPMVFAKTGGALLMNGFTVDQDDHEKALASFWQLYRAVDPNHAVYTMHPSRLGSVLPLMYHGDEGRGRLKRAVLVTSFVSALPVSGHPFLSHLLCTVFPGERYATGDDGVETLEALHAAVARDLNELLEHGWEVLASTCFIWLWSIYVYTCMLGCMRLKKDGSKKTMFVGMVGVRGDWPWQRLPPRCIHKKNAVCLLLPWAQALRKMPPVVHRVHIGPGMPLMQW